VGVGEVGGIERNDYALHVLYVPERNRDVETVKTRKWSP